MTQQTKPRKEQRKMLGVPQAPLVGDLQQDRMDLQKEDAPVMAASHGAVAGLGVGPQGEPPVSSSRMFRRKKFAGAEVFEVNSDWFHRARMGKRHYGRYEHYVGNDETGLAIREYGNTNYGKPIVIQDERTGAMCYLRYGNRK